MLRQVISAPDAPKAMGAYSPAIKAGNLLFVSGRDPDRSAISLCGAAAQRPWASSVVADAHVTGHVFLLLQIVRVAREHDRDGILAASPHGSDTAPTTLPHVLRFDRQGALQGNIEPGVERQLRGAGR